MLPILAIIVPVYNEEDMLPLSLVRLERELDKLIENKLISINSFLLFVDDGSVDNSWSLLKTAYNKGGKIRALKLSRNFGHNNALLAGLMFVKDLCDVTISIDCDLQQDPGLIPQFLEKYQEGCQVVLGIRNDRRTDSLFKKYTALGFYKLMQIMGVKLFVNHADYRLIGKKALQALAAYHEPNLFLRAITIDLGFQSGVVYFDVKDREYGTTSYSFRKMLKFAINGITSFSIVPLRIVSILGIVIFGLSLIMAAYILLATLVIGRTIPGWASTILPIYLLGGLQILCIGVVGEYLAQVYNTTKGRPRYIIEIELL